MTKPTPEDLAKEFARRWFAHESVVLREMGERELAQVIRTAIALQRSEAKHDEDRAA